LPYENFSGWSIAAYLVESLDPPKVSLVTLDTNYDVTKYRTARTTYIARTALRVDMHGE